MPFGECHISIQELMCKLGSGEGTRCQCRLKESSFSEQLCSSGCGRRTLVAFPLQGRAQFSSVSETSLTAAAFLSASWPLAVPLFQQPLLPQTLFKNRLSCMKKHHNVILVLSAHLPSRHLQKTVDESSVSPGPTEVANFLLRHLRSGLARQYPNGTIS